MAAALKSKLLHLLFNLLVLPTCTPQPPKRTFLMWPAWLSPPVPLAAANNNILSMISNPSFLGLDKEIQLAIINAK